MTEPRLGFAVEVEDAENATAALTSTVLSPEQIYTREELKELFAITDATLNTGVFRPKGTSSVWLFITEEKTADRTQYRDRLVGEALHWQGQTAGRTDALVIEHEARGLELLVFFRKRKYEHPGAGFRYLGEFRYVTHSGSAPTSFVLQRRLLAPLLPADQADEDLFDPTSIQDARQRISRMIAQRRGQRAFRDALIAAYGGRCAISGCAILDVLEAAHIHPYRGPETNKVSNGLLLRADIHTLFDCGLIAIDDEKMRVIVAPRLRATEYGSFHDREILPSVSKTASKEALAKHRRSHK